MLDDDSTDRGASLVAALASRSAIVVLAAGLIGAMATLALPNPLLETWLSRLGVSELLPAAAPPLGWTARALVALAGGLVTAALVQLLLPRRPVGEEGEIVATMAAWPEPEPEPRYAATDEDAVDFEPAPRHGMLSRLQALRRGRAEPDDTVEDFEDLPRLRGEDRHPDAPPRRPISASAELGAPLTLEEGDRIDPNADVDAGMPDAQAPIDAPDTRDEPVVAFQTDLPPLAQASLEAAMAPEPVEVSAPVAPMAAPPRFIEPVVTESAPIAAQREPTESLSIPALLARFERGLAYRRGIATPEPGPAFRTATTPRAENDQPSSPSPLPHRGQASAGADGAGNGDMDEALRAALETLRQMTERQRNAS